MKMLLSLFMCIIPAIASAQTLSGAITGVVRDLNGKPIPQANVYATASDNIKRRITAISDLSGRFRLSEVLPGTYEVRAYKEIEGYPDTFFAFFYAGNDRNWKSVRVDSGQAVEGVVLQLGPKCAKLKLSIIDEKGNSVGGGVWFTRAQDTKRIYGVGVAPNTELLVPPVAFRFEIERQGYEVWRSKSIRLKSDQSFSVRVQLKSSH